jgi:hypothetical protein
MVVGIGLLAEGALLRTLPSDRKGGACAAAELGWLAGA